MKKIENLLIILSLSLFPAVSGAQIALETHPADPTTQQQIVLGISGSASCVTLGEPFYPAEPNTVRIWASFECHILPAPPEPYQFWVPIGPLSPGKWTLEVEGAGQELLATTIVRVRYPDHDIGVTPTLPTVNDDITLRLFGVGSCTFVDPPQIEDRTISIAVNELGICDPPPPFEPYEIPVEIGLLSAGLWEVEFYTHGGGVIPIPGPPELILLATIEFEVHPASFCETGEQALCLQEGRFRVEAEWETAEGFTGQAQALDLTPDSGLFWFFEETNLELIVKVIDGCQIFERFWVFASGLTNVGVTLTVTDLLTSEEWFYETNVGETFEPVLDTQAFATCLEE